MSNENAQEPGKHPAPQSWIDAAQAAGGIGAFRLDLRARRWDWTPELALLFGLPPDAPRSLTELRMAIFADDLPKLEAAIEAAPESGGFYVELRSRHRDGSVHWLAGKGRVERDAAGQALALSGTCHEITDRKMLEARLLALNETLEARVAELRDEARTLEILNRSGVSLAAQLDLERLVQTVTDAGVALTEAQFGAFFYNVLNEQGEAYMLYTLSGASREAFASFPMPRNTPVFEPTFRGLGIVRSDDITADPRYGKVEPHFGMPKGHLPVRSYLAIPVMSRSGEVLGGLFFGHGDPGVFTEKTERILSGIAAQAAIAIDNAHLYMTSQREVEARTRTEEALQRLNETLEQRVENRTRQLEVSFAELRDSERRFRLIVEAVTDYAIFMLDPGGHIINWNPGAERIKGYTAEEIVGQHFSRFYTAEDIARGMPQTVLDGAARTGKHATEGWRLRKDGSRFWASAIVGAIRDSDGTLLGFAKVTRDLTERRGMEEQLRQAQKMEAVGQLTGGVAHDFNNLLTVISGNVETLLRRLPESQDDLRRLATAALRGATRGGVLTHRLLAFARRQALEPTAQSVNTLIAGMSEMLRRTLGENIRVETVLSGGLWSIYVDAIQLESSILNLAINARDAMPDGGKLTIEAANVYLDETYATVAEVPSGQYVGIFVSDTGMGMTPEVITKAFDPFFTTKEIGQGTGLGLSQVYGFVKQSGGHIKIYSEPGEGTTLKLYLPRHYAGEEAIDIQAAPATPRAREETILVVEDDPDVRGYTVETLLELGYRVLEAVDGPSALRQLEANPDIDLLFTDVGLPGEMNGRQLADEAARRRRGLKVLFTSGYARNAIVHHGRLDPGVELIVKPFNFASLASKLRRVIDGK